MVQEDISGSYTGIGARETPENILAVMERLAVFLAQEKYLLRSGGAEGASAAFEKGCDSAGGPKTIFLPWRGFNGNNSDIYSVPERSFIIAQGFNPAWNTLNESARKLQGRYVLTMLGMEMREPSKFVICYTRGGKKKGGTGQALRYAEKYDIPVFDMGEFEDDLAAMKDGLVGFLGGFGLDPGSVEL